MPIHYETLQTALKTSPQTWLVTGVAGFIGKQLLANYSEVPQNLIHAIVEANTVWE